MTYTIALTGNEARFLFFSIKNKKSPEAQAVRRKLAQMSAQDGSPGPLAGRPEAAGAACLG